MEYEQISPEQRVADHVELLLRDPETVSELDLSYLATVMRPREWRDMLLKVAKAYKEKTGNALQSELIFSIEDPNIKDKVSFLRWLKALREEAKCRAIIQRIIVKGPKSTPDIEPNVFASDVQFQLMENN